MHASRVRDSPGDGRGTFDGQEQSVMDMRRPCLAVAACAVKAALLPAMTKAEPGGTVKTRGAEKSPVSLYWMTKSRSFGSALPK